jgi:FRG domain
VVFKLKLKLSPQVTQQIELRRNAQSIFQDYMKWTESHQPPRWVYRGQPQHWPLKPSVGRVAHYKPETELQLFQEFRRLALPYVKENRSLTEWDWLALAQHHGVPTRLLDWTTNPLVAFYFACEQSQRGKKDGEVIAVQANQNRLDKSIVGNLGDPFEITNVGFIYPSAVASRISAQRGLFSVHPNPTNPWRLRNQTDRFNIPAEFKPYLKRYLFNVGVDAALVMADLDGLASSLNWRFRSKVPFE